MRKIRENKNDGQQTSENKITTKNLSLVAQKRFNQYVEAFYISVFFKSSAIKSSKQSSKANFKLLWKSVNKCGNNRASSQWAVV